MNQRVTPSDLELAALISSKICHDIISPVGAIYNGIEILDEDDSADSRKYAMEVIRNVTEQAAARLKFARFAFGAAGSAGAKLDLGEAEQISRDILAKSKHSLVWRGQPGHMPKDKAKLLLNLVAAAVTALPGGGEIGVTIEGTLDEPRFQVRCKGARARPPQYLCDYVAGGQPAQLDAMTVQAYYTWRLAGASRMRLDIVRDGADVLLLALPG